MQNHFDFLERGLKDLSKDELQTVGALCEKLKAAKEDAEIKKAEFKKAENLVKVYSQKQIPATLHELNIDSLKLKTGETVAVKTAVKVTLPKIEGEKRDGVFEWLEENGLGGISKKEVRAVIPVHCSSDTLSAALGALNIEHQCVIEFTPDNEKEFKKIKEELEKWGFGYTVKNDIHHATLKAAINDITGFKKGSVPRVGVEDIPAALNPYVLSETTIK